MVAVRTGMAIVALEIVVVTFVVMAVATVALMAVVMAGMKMVHQVRACCGRLAGFPD